MLPTLAETTHLLRCRGCVILSRLQTTSPPCHRWRRCFGSRPPENHYTVLDVKKSATQTEIKDAFLSKSKMMHPDLNPDDPTMHKRFIRLNEAYTVLSRPPSRREYDYTLAARLAYQQRMRPHQGSHSEDGSHMPGSGTYHGGDATEKPFWDETIFEMRDKNKDYDRFYGDNNYYGVKGIPKQSNIYVLIGCFMVMALGAIMHFGTILYSNNVARVVFDERDRKAHEHLADARRRARENGNEKQLALMKARYDEHAFSPSKRSHPPDS